MSGVTLITGGAGFVGTNTAERLLRNGGRVRILDDLSREGVDRNLQWLQRTHGERLEVEIGNVRNPEIARRAVRGACAIYHFAAQVAVTTSFEDPVQDAGVNLLGTLAMLEATRLHAPAAPFVFTSTNKVYGGLEDVGLTLDGDQYQPSDDEIRRHGISETRPLAFCTPYGCSKGAADQYVYDYARSYGLATVVFRMSCIYGPHQFGNEDQGWVAHFVKQALSDQPITIFGDGCQVRDLLYVEDLVDALLLAGHQAEELAGRAFNIGGGPGNTCSLRDVLGIIGELRASPPQLRSGEWRQGDQRYYVSDTSSFGDATGWSPRMNVRSGVARLHDWLDDEQQLQRRLSAGVAA